jgi:dihydroorotase
VFDDAGALDKLEGFLSLNGPAYYGVEPNEETITVTKTGQPAEFPGEIAAGNDRVVVFEPGIKLFWHVGKNDARSKGV